ncbi:hypothetical protein [Salipiger bermudensis]|uniref:hypothetical protein n=1 Tax=Salipiger bermudensis TaxID=344736 RepID=UPI001A8E3B69|nr:hypothetical protein [Salipiger bermudensis]MBN9675956.1 hypothetical protein [Salipiger bermudensis]
MKKPLTKKPARKSPKPQFEMSQAMRDRMEKAMATVGRLADKEARKDDKVQREARAAIADTFDAWLDWLEESAPEQVDEVFFELGCFATATNRRRIFKHAKAPEGVVEKVQEQVELWKIEEAEARAATDHETQDQETADANV